MPVSENGSPNAFHRQHKTSHSVIQKGAKARVKSSHPESSFTAGSQALLAVMGCQHPSSCVQGLAGHFWMLSGLQTRGWPCERRNPMA